MKIVFNKKEYEIKECDKVLLDENVSKNLTTYLLNKNFSNDELIPVTIAINGFRGKKDELIGDYCLQEGCVLVTGDVKFKQSYPGYAVGFYPNINYKNVLNDIIDSFQASQNPIIKNNRVLRPYEIKDKF